MAKAQSSTLPKVPEGVTVSIVDEIPQASREGKVSKYAALFDALPAEGKEGALKVEFETEKEAKSATYSIRGYARRKNIAVRVSHRGEVVYVARKAD